MLTNFSPWPCYTELEADAIQRVLLSNKVNYWTGTECREFEKEFAAWANVKYAVTLANGTIALGAALHAINLKAGDEVVVAARGFIASVSSIVMHGGIPIFADVDEQSQNISADSIRAVLTPRTKAIICVHLAGWPCDMDPILNLADELGLFVIEDCAQAHGAKYKGRPVGSLGHIAAWSFCQDKIMTTGGEGGMVTTNDHQLWLSMWSYKDHGKSYQAIHQAKKPFEFNWVHHGYGINGRMTELQAAIGRLQLQKMPTWHQQRLANAKRIWQVAAGLKGLRVPVIPDDITHAAYKCYLFLDEKQLAPGWDQLRILKEINARAVPCYYGACPEIYLEKTFDNTNWRPSKRLPIAKRLGETSLMFLVHPSLLTSEIEKTTEVLKEVMIMATT